MSRLDNAGLLLIYGQNTYQEYVNQPSVLDKLVHG